MYIWILFPVLNWSSKLNSVSTHLKVSRWIYWDSAQRVSWSADVHLAWGNHRRRHPSCHHCRTRTLPTDSALNWSILFCHYDQAYPEIGKQLFHRLPRLWFNISHRVYVKANNNIRENEHFWQDNIQVFRCQDNHRKFQTSFLCTFRNKLCWICMTKYRTEIKWKKFPFSKIETVPPEISLKVSQQRRYINILTKPILCTAIDLDKSQNQRNNVKTIALSYCQNC